MADEIDSNEARLLQAMSVDDTVKPAAEYIARAGTPLPNKEVPAKMYNIIEAIKTVSDPEIMINVYDLGSVWLKSGDNKVTLTISGYRKSYGGYVLCTAGGNGIVRVCLSFSLCYSKTFPVNCH